MITLKEMLAEPQTMYDGGMVQHMAEGGEPEIKFQEGQPIEIEGRKFPSLVTAEGTSPKKLYRYASPQEWKEIIKTGELSPSNFYERTHASASPETGYSEKGSILLEIEYSPEDAWYSKMGGDKFYGVTKKKIPISRITNVTEPQPLLDTPPVSKNVERNLPRVVEFFLKGLRGAGSPLSVATAISQMDNKTREDVLEVLSTTSISDFLGMANLAQQSILEKVDLEKAWEEIKDYFTVSPSESNPQIELAKEKGFTKLLTHVSFSPEIVNDILRVIPEVDNENPLLTHDIGIHMTEQTETPHVFDAFKRREITPSNPLIREYWELQKQEPTHLKVEKDGMNVIPQNSDEYAAWVDKEMTLKDQIKMRKYLEEVDRKEPHKRPNNLMTDEEFNKYIWTHITEEGNLDFPEGINVIPLYAKLDRYISVPDMGVFKNPENWIREMSYNTYGGELFNDELLEEVLTAAEEAGTEVDDTYAVMDEYAASQETQYPESVIELYPDYPDYDDKIYMNRESMPDIHIEGESVIPFETKVELWKHITSGALRFRDHSSGTERDKAWVEFLRNTLDKMGADAYGYKNDIEGGGEVSYMFLHPEKAKSRSSKGFDITKQEMGKYRGGQIRPMYDGGIVQHMSEGGEPESNLPVPIEEEESLVGDIVEYVGKVGKKVGRKAVDIATKRVPGIGLISSSPAGETPEELELFSRLKQSARGGIGEREPYEGYVPETEPYNKEVYHTTSELRWPNVREESGDIPNVNPKQAGSDIGFHVMEKKDLPQYYNVKKYWDEMITMPLKANIRKTIEIPDMSRFRNPKNWIEKMSVDRQVRTDLSEEELKKYFIDTNPKALNKGRMYPKPSVIEKLSNDREEALKLWKHIVQGASRYAPEFESGLSETSERWINFLRNVLDKTGADAFSYENYKEGTGELSHMFLDPPETIGEKIKLKHNIEPDPTRPELSKYKGGQVRPMYDGGLV